MSKKMVSASHLKIGSYIIIDDAACKVVDIKVSRPGKHGHAKSNITAVGILDDKKRNMTVPGHDNVEVPVIDKRTAQVLSIAENNAHVMDVESFETFDLAIPDELKDEIAEGSNVLFWDILGERVMKQVKSD